MRSAHPGGDPINFFDADGRYGKEVNGWVNPFSPEGIAHRAMLSGLPIPSSFDTFKDRMGGVSMMAGIYSSFAALHQTRSFSERLWDQAIKGDYASADNGGAGILGQTLTGAVPWVGQAADARDWSAAANEIRTKGLGWRTGGGMVLATAAWVPVLGDAAKGLLKPLFRTADDVPLNVLTHTPTPHMPITDPSRLLPAPSGSNPWMPGTVPHSMPAPPNTYIDMAMAPGQVRPGGWGTFDNISDVNFVRNDLAVTPDFKPEVSHVQRFQVPEGVQIQTGVVGPQTWNGITLPGNANQVQILNFGDRSKLIPVGEPRRIQ